MSYDRSYLDNLKLNELGRGVVEAEIPEEIPDMIKIKGVHDQCHIIFVHALRRICGDYMENKCDAILPELKDDTNILVENMINNEKLMNTLNEVIEEEYKFLYSEDTEIEAELEAPKEVKQVRQNTSTMNYFDDDDIGNNRNIRKPEVVEMERFDSPNAKSYNKSKEDYKLDDILDSL